MKLSTLFISLLAFLLISCGSNKGNSKEKLDNDSVTKQVDTAQLITEKYWKLIRLRGKDVKMVENQEREIFFILKANNNSVKGFAGCNSITGGYELEEKENIIQFKNMGLTMKDCPDVDVDESKIMDMFEFANNYTIQDDTLILNIGERAPLAVFVAIYM